MPEKHYAMRRSFRRWLARRSAARFDGEHAVRQRRNALILLVTTVARAVFWVVLLGCVAAGLAHEAGFGWARNLSQAIWFVVLLSLYANFATDSGAAIASYAALVSADVHTEVTVSARLLAADIAGLQEDVDRLAGMTPGEEATVLAENLKEKLARTVPLVSVTNDQGGGPWRH
jgi:hypothetical protein